MKNLIITFLIILVGLFVFSQVTTDRQKLVNKNKSFESEKLVSREKSKKIIKTDKSLLHIAQLISPPSDQELIYAWENEYSCLNDESCNKFIFNARSYEDALWLKRKGYPSKSAVSLLQDISKEDLGKLSQRGNVNAMNLLAIYSMKNNYLKNAKAYAMSSIAHAGSRETFGYRLYSKILLEDHDPMTATFYLRMASILGDTNATATYEQITANSSSALIDNTNRMAYSYLLKKLNTDINNLNNDPRPINGDGG